MKDSKGFSLIEILVAMGIIVLMFSIALPNISSFFQISINSTARDLASRIKETYNAAVISGRVYRVAFDLKEKAYWVESGPAQLLLDTKESAEKAAHKKKFQMSLNGKEESSSAFTMDKSITRKKVGLPTGVQFDGIRGPISTEPQKEGMAYAHFFPSGLSEKTIIYLKDGSKHEISLVISALLGTTDLYNRHIEGTEIFGR